VGGLIRFGIVKGIKASPSPARTRRRSVSRPGPL